MPKQLEQLISVFKHQLHPLLKFFQWYYRIDFQQYHVWHEANFRLKMDELKCQVIARKLGTEPIIAALLDNLGILFACDDIAVEDKVTAAISQFADVVPAEEAGLKGYCDVAYKIKPEFEKCFEVSEEELETARIAIEVERTDVEARIEELLNQILPESDNEE